MKRSWRASVLDALQRLADLNQSAIITRQQLIHEELPRIIEETQTKGVTPEFTLSYELQQLRDTGFVDFVKPGHYRLLKPVVDAETFDGSDTDLDQAITEGRLKIGRVETANELTLQNRRRGQRRLRQLALATYESQCALCDLNDESFLITSHIAPWAESEDGRGDLHNVIILCRPHDSLFEGGYWSLTNELMLLRRLTKPLPWVIDALLPNYLTFRVPQSHPPIELYLQVHRQRFKFHETHSD